MAARENTIKAVDVINDPSLFLYAVDSAKGNFHFLTASREALEQNNFLDDRIKLDGAFQYALSLRQIESLPIPAPDRPLQYIFHSAFCCSTLLARALSHHPYTLSLKEPLALRNLADMKVANPSMSTEDFAAWIAHVCSLLAKPWSSEETLLIKPTNMVAGIIRQLLHAQPRSRGIILISELEDFLVSVLGKPNVTQQKMPWLADYFGASHPKYKRFKTELPTLSTMNAAVAVWYFQRWHFQNALEQLGGSRLRVLSAKQLLAEPLQSLLSVSDFLDLNIPGENLKATVAGEVWHCHAKARGRKFNAATRAESHRKIQQLHKPEILSALEYAESLQTRLGGSPSLSHLLLNEEGKTAVA